MVNIAEVIIVLVWQLIATHQALLMLQIHTVVD